ncbi:unnamed protein product [Schistosoma margrebowiei]|uniref:Uncharacterized protein n=1 Tax=Schistosoma margrebowiei TaxID=48269 RepID=A0A183MC69_9TREM|nr:unnamed protein product [Schistosoma margrebowiei]
MHMQPTCFQTDPAQPDLNGYHWLIIDFGIHLHHIKEIRLAPNPFHKYFGKLNHHYFQQKKINLYKKIICLKNFIVCFLRYISRPTAGLDHCIMKVKFTLFEIQNSHLN